MRVELNKLDALVLLDYIDELEALIEEDDGTFFTTPMLAKHEEAKEVIYELAERL